MKVSEPEQKMIVAARSLLFGDLTVKIKDGQVVHVEKSEVVYNHQEKRMQLSVSTKSTERIRDGKQIKFCVRLFLFMQGVVEMPNNGKRSVNVKWKWHLDFSKVRRLNGIYQQIAELGKVQTGKPNIWGVASDKVGSVIHGGSRIVVDSAPLEEEKRRA